jgi:hypothetical protein
LITIGNLATDVIGKTTVGEAYVGTALDDGDVGQLIKSAKSRRSGSTTSHATDDHNSSERERQRERQRQLS